MKLLSLCIPGPNGTECISAPPGIPTAERGITLDRVLQWGLTTFIIICVIVALVYLIWNGIRWITSGGDKQKVASARQGVIYAIIGLILVFLSFFIISLIGTFFGVKLIPTFDAMGGNGGGPNNPRPGDCPDNSGNYYCGVTDDTNCPVCSSDPGCQNATTYSIASCSGTAVCTVDEDCSGRSPSCPLGETGDVVCNVLPGHSSGSCVTSGCHAVPPGPN